jgi:hypothetical protein
MMVDKNIATSEENYKEILSYVKDFFRTRKFIFLSLLVAFILAIFSLFSTPKTYSSKVTFIVQGADNTKAKGGISGIVSLLNGGSTSTGSTSDIPTFLYPQIIESLNFKRKLSETALNFKGLDSTMTFSKYVLDVEKPALKSQIFKYTIGLPGLLFSSSGKNTTVHQIDSLEYISSSENKIFNSLKEKIIFKIDEDDGTLELGATFVNEPFAAAQLAQSAKEILQNEIIRYRIANAKEKYSFIDKQYEEKKSLFDASQVSLARYNDRNLFNATSSSLVRRKQLEDKSMLLYTIYSDLEQQRLAQSIKIQEDTPTFTVINPAVVPGQADSKNSMKTIALFLFVGFFVSILRYIFIVAKRYIKSLWREV